MNIDTLLRTSDDTGELVILGYKPLEEVVEEVRHSDIVNMLSWTGGIKLQVALYRYKDISDQITEEIAEGTYLGLEDGIEVRMDDADISLIHAAYLLMPDT